MQSITLEEAQANLSKLVDQLRPNEEVIITRANRPIARLIGESAQARRPRVPGCMMGSIASMAPDFDAPLEDFGQDSVIRIW